MVTSHACPSCRQINPAEAEVCLGCGVALSIGSRETAKASGCFVERTRPGSEEDTVPGVHLDAPELQRWIDTGPDGLDPTREPFTLSLRPIAALSAVEDRDSMTDSLPSGVVLRSDGVSALADPARAKAARRAAVRRSRLASHQSEPGTTATSTDVLVLERDAQAREQLCSMLESFGFRVHPAQTPVQAVHRLDAKHFAAVFLDVAFDGPEQRASVDLCQRIKAEVPRSTGRASALIIVSGSSRPVERVRATLAGSDAFLAKPMTRGSVAQALEACNVPLPADSRRS